MTTNQGSRGGPFTIPAPLAGLTGRYRLERELGSGGAATVYLAEDLKQRRRVAVKVLRPELSESLGADRFLREIEIAAGLRHPHILPLFESGELPADDATGARVLYYVMPFVEGETLRDRLSRERQLPISDALRITREVADALAYAHARGIVHRDIKPANILLDGGHAVVADFGIARALASASPRDTLTATGMTVGTPAYMSPEQAAGERDVDARSDIYSLACVTYEMLAGQPPFSGATIEALVRQHLAVTPTSVATIRPTVTPMVADAIARALAKTPADRFDSATQFADALEQRPVVAAPRSPRPFARRPAMLIGTGLLAIALIATAMWRSRIPAAAADGPSSTATPDASRTIAVLPFENIDGDTSTSPLALGVHAEVVTQLSKLGALRVTSRGSTLEYRGSAKRPRDIAAELGVTTLLTGSVQRSGNKVRLTVDLSDPRRGHQLWAESYDRELTAENLFDVQADIARQVAAALQVRMTTEQQTALSRAPTASLAALDRYHRALIASGVGPASDDAIAARLLEEAVKLDSGFVEAWSLLARVRSYMLRAGEANDTLDAWAAVERTATLAPGSFEPHVARGFYRYYAHADYQGALQLFRQADRLSPGSPDVSLAIGYVLRRLGRWNEAVEHLQRARDLGPRDVRVLAALGNTYQIMRRWDDALREFDRALVIVPSGQNVILHKFDVLLAGRGDTASARAFAVASAPVLDPEWVAYTDAMLAIAGRRYDVAASAFATYGALSDNHFSIDFPVSPTLGIALSHRFAGDNVMARRYADSTLALGQRELARRRRRGPADPFGTQAIVELQMAAASAIKGEAATAIAMAERAAARWPVARDAVDGGVLQELLAGVYVLAGRPREAVETLAAISAVPANVSGVELRLDPLWDPLRNRPEFQALVADSRSTPK